MRFTSPPPPPSMHLLSLVLSGWQRTHAHSQSERDLPCAAPPPKCTLCYPATQCTVCCPTAPAGGVAAFVAAMAWLVVRRSRGQSAYAGLPAGALHASHAAHGLPSVIPGVRERFDLTEVVEQTGGFLRLAIGHAPAFVRWRALRTLS